jgi:hypothetical protein
MVVELQVWECMHENNISGASAAFSLITVKTIKFTQ